MTRNRGCFDRHDDSDAREYASPPCYMREVDPSYFGSLSSPPSMPGRNPNGAKVIATAPLKDRARGNAIVAWAELRTLIGTRARAIGRHAAAQIERVEALRKAQAVVRLPVRTGPKR